MEKQLLKPKKETQIIKTKKYNPEIDPDNFKVTTNSKIIKHANKNNTNKKKNIHEQQILKPPKRKHTTNITKTHQQQNKHNNKTHN